MIKSNLTNAYMMFLMDLADLSICDQKQIEKEMKGKIQDLFDCQSNGDRAKRLLKDQFGKALAIYFSSFTGSDGLNHARLEREITRNRKHMLRHLGKDKLNYLTLITGLMSASGEKPKQGLLFAVGS